MQFTAYVCEQKSHKFSAAELAKKKMHATKSGLDQTPFTCSNC